MRLVVLVSLATLASVGVAATACDEFSEGSDAADAGSADASTGDASGGDGGTGPFCSGVKAGLCWSFDDESAGSALYGPSFEPKNDTKLVKLTPLAKSPPNAMRAEGDGDSGPWMLRADIPAVTQVTCTMALFIEDITNHTEVLTFALGTGSAAFFLEPLDENAVKAALLYDRMGPKLVDGLPNLPKNRWLRVALAGQRVGDTGFILAAAADDSKEVTADFSDASANVFAKPLAVEIGYYAQYGGKGAVRVDDILCTYE